MSQVISFTNYRPAPRYDTLPWTGVNIEEATDPGGPWTQIDSITFLVPDVDPADPQARSFTTELASSLPDLWYRIIFFDATDDTSEATIPIQNTLVVPSSRDYITLASLKATLEMSGHSYADEDMVVSITAASREVDYLTNRRFWLDDAPNQRVYIPRWSRVQIDDIFTVTTISATSGTSTSTLVNGTDFSLLPLNAAADGRPFETIQFLSTAGVFPDMGLPSVSVTGTFGWPVVPQNVVAATTILAARILRRQREAPFGIVTVGIEQGAVARISQTDPDVMALLSDFTKEKVLIALA
jgi:hypothetical protein